MDTTDPDTMTLDQCREYVGKVLNMPGDPPATIEGALGVIEQMGLRWMMDTRVFFASAKSWSLPMKLTKVKTSGNYTLDAWRLAAKVVKAEKKL